MSILLSDIVTLQISIDLLLQQFYILISNLSHKINIALVGNPNSGKTSLFNALTGLNQKVGNFPGVTVEKNENTIIFKLPE